MSKAPFMCPTIMVKKFFQIIHNSEKMAISVSQKPAVKFHEILEEDTYGHLLLGLKSSDSLLELFCHSVYFVAILVINAHSDQIILKDCFSSWALTTNARRFLLPICNEI